MIMANETTDGTQDEVQTLKQIVHDLLERMDRVEDELQSIKRRSPKLHTLPPPVLVEEDPNNSILHGAKKKKSISMMSKEMSNDGVIVASPKILFGRKTVTFDETVEQGYHDDEEAAQLMNSLSVAPSKVNTPTSSSSITISLNDDGTSDFNENPATSDMGSIDPSESVYYDSRMHSMMEPEKWDSNHDINTDTTTNYYDSALLTRSQSQTQGDEEVASVSTNAEKVEGTISTYQRQLSSIKRSFTKNTRISIFAYQSFQRAQQRNSEDSSTPLSNTETLHMYSVATIVHAMKASADASTHSGSLKQWKARFFTMLSLLLIILQICVLNFVIFETNHTTCAGHTDCQVGSYCHGHQSFESTELPLKSHIQDGYRQPRCNPCNLNNNSTDIYEKFCGTINQGDSWSRQDVDHTVLWFSKDFTPHYSEGITPANMTQELFLTCLSYKHCIDTELSNEREIDIISSYFTLNANRLSLDQIFVFMFIAILFGGTISQELLEAAMEDATLDTMIHEMRTRSAVDVSTLSFTVRMMRLSLKVRQVIIPTYASAATISVLLMDSLSSKNILLNFLALSFLLEADNILAKIFLSSKQHLFVENVLFNDDSGMQSEDEAPSHSLSTSSVNWAKMNGLFLSVAIVIIVCNIVQVLNRCKTVDIIMTNILSIGNIINVLSNATRKSTQCKITWIGIHSFLLAIIEGSMAIAFSNVIAIGISSMILLRFSVYKLFEIFILCSAGAFFFFLGLEIVVETFKNTSHFISRKVTIGFCLMISMAYLLLFSTLFPFHDIIQKMNPAETNDS